MEKKTNRLVLIQVLHISSSIFTRPPMLKIQDNKQKEFGEKKKKSLIPFATKSTLINPSAVYSSSMKRLQSGRQGCRRCGWARNLHEEVRVRSVCCECSVGVVVVGVNQGHEFINDKLDVTVGRRRSHTHTHTHTHKNKSIISAMIALLLAVGSCSGPRSRYYSGGDKRQHKHAAGGAEKCGGQRDPLCSNAMSAQQLIVVHKSEYPPLLPFHVVQKQDLNVSLDIYIFFCERGSNIKGQAEYLHWRKNLLT